MKLVLPPDFAWRDLRCGFGGFLLFEQVFLYFAFFGHLDFSWSDDAKGQHTVDGRNPAPPKNP